MSIIRKNPLNFNSSNFVSPKQIKMYDEANPPPSKSLIVETTSEGSTLESKPVETSSGISFEKGPPTLTFDVPDSEPSLQPESPTEQSPEQKRQERAAAFKKAADVERRAQQELKAAREQLAQVKQFNELMAQAKKDPTAIARALGMDPTEFLRQYQNSMFNIPSEPDKPKEETLEERMSRYEQERRAEKEELLRMQSHNIRTNYIQSKILPVIQADLDKYELINSNGVEQSASFIYDLMDAHYRNTGEELNAADVAEEMENQLMKEFESRIEFTKNVKKLKKHFRTDTDAPGVDVTIPEPLGMRETRTSTQDNQQLGVNLTQSNSLSATPSQGLPTRRPIMENPYAQIQSQQTPTNTAFLSKKEAKLKRMEEFLKQAKESK